ncbi:hypothetical protein ASPZODRAFT_162510 [Penicilliopsis zonata CBS 506.65]|uniref:SET domain-containing protein n=1 Tax=Penicilliopsis zonata CBS 506.65 TaxID=1073090 RepID=A0A1L9STM5_9EURO|nr:hypothetical protein ASPZODRAFT_162510 [Penicilliopsis zonata CBS 506.65]OJJ50549.1 hypothetical protein ASPZODRAFT_162510 [Penicilliopsis zonata CBS 506.65]
MANTDPFPSAYGDIYDDEEEDLGPTPRYRRAWMGDVKGAGLLANKEIDPGNIIMKDPIVHLTRDEEASAASYEDMNRMVGDRIREKGVDFVRSFCHLPRDERLELGPFFRIWAVSSIPVMSETGISKVVGLELAHINHACQPNAHITVVKEKTEDGTGFQYVAVVRAITDIAVGEEITVSYMFVHRGIAERRREISERFCFECLCRRCTNPNPRFERFAHAFEQTWKTLHDEKVLESSPAGVLQEAHHLYMLFAESEVEDVRLAWFWFRCAVIAAMNSDAGRAAFFFLQVKAVYRSLEGPHSHHAALAEKWENDMQLIPDFGRWERGLSGKEEVEKLAKLKNNAIEMVWMLGQSPERYIRLHRFRIRDNPKDAERPEMYIKRRDKKKTKKQKKEAPVERVSGVFNPNQDTDDIPAMLALGELELPYLCGIGGFPIIIPFNKVKRSESYGPEDSPSMFPFSKTRRSNSCDIDNSPGMLPLGMVKRSDSFGAEDSTGMNLLGKGKESESYGVGDSSGMLPLGKAKRSDSYDTEESHNFLGNAEKSQSPAFKESPGLLPIDKAEHSSCAVEKSPALLPIDKGEQSSCAAEEFPSLLPIDKVERSDSCDVEESFGMLPLAKAKRSDSYGDEEAENSHYCAIEDSPGLPPINKTEQSSSPVVEESSDVLHIDKAEQSFFSCVEESVGMLPKAERSQSPPVEASPLEKAEESPSFAVEESPDVFTLGKTERSDSCDFEESLGMPPLGNAEKSQSPSVDASPDVLPLDKAEDSFSCAIEESPGTITLGKAERSGSSGFEESPGMLPLGKAEKSHSCAVGESPDVPPLEKAEESSSRDVEESAETMFFAKHKAAYHQALEDASRMRPLAKADSSTLFSGMLPHADMLVLGKPKPTFSYKEEDFPALSPVSKAEASNSHAGEESVKENVKHVEKSLYGTVFKHTTKETGKETATDEALTKPASESIKKETNGSFDKPSNPKSVSGNVDKPVIKPADKPVIKPVDKPVKKSTDKDTASSVPKSAGVQTNNSASETIGPQGYTPRNQSRYEPEWPEDPYEGIERHTGPIGIPLSMLADLMPPFKK